MNYLIALILITASLVIIAWTNNIQKRRERKEQLTYSYVNFVKYYLIGIFIIVIMSIVIRQYSSWEIALSVGVFAFFCLTAGLINNLFAQHQIKRRGGRKE